MNTADLVERLQRYLGEQLELAIAPVRPDEPLIENGHIDSMDVVRIAAHLEDLLGVEIPDQDVSDENFGSLERIVAYATGRGALD